MAEALQDLRFDAAVVGGGLAGTVAAVAAARRGISVLLVERHGFLGGNATAGAVGQFIGWSTLAGRRVIRGIAEEIVQRLQARGGGDGHHWFTMSTGHRIDRVQYDPEVLKVVLDELAVGAGVTVLFHAAVAAVRRDGRSLTGLELLTKGGLMSVLPKVLVDASGELDALSLAGAEFLPLQAGESLQPGTMMFRLGPIDFETFDAVTTEERRALGERGVAEGRLTRAAVHCARIPGTDDGWFNVTRVSLDATDPMALSAAEIEGRRQALEAARFIVETVPGCGAARLMQTAPQIGIRESRRIAGEHVLQADELRRGEVFADTVCCGAYPIDIHHAEGAALTLEAFAPDHYYRIPYRALVPRDFDNALVAGRGLSATHEALGAVRTMPTAMAIGEAAGAAAALAVQSNAPMARLDSERLRDGLRAAGAVVD